MNLIVDDREKLVIPHLKPLFNITVKRITVGDYVYTLNDEILCIVERKSLEDLSASIKDGRMENHNKLLNAQKTCKCVILYIIEGSLYPNINKKFSGIKFKCLQGKLDSIMFKNDVKIIWTRDIKHTAERLAGLCKTFVLCNEDKLLIEKQKLNPLEIINAKHESPLDMIHVNMLRTIPGVSYNSAFAMLKKFNIKQLLLCRDVTAEDWCCAKNTNSEYKIGNRGIKMFNSCHRLNELPDVQENILSCIQGVTKDTAHLILKHANIYSIIKCDFEKKSISVIKRNNGRCLGSKIEHKIIKCFVID